MKITNKSDPVRNNGTLTFKKTHQGGRQHHVWSGSRLLVLHASEHMAPHLEVGVAAVIVQLAVAPVSLRHCVTLHWSGLVGGHSLGHGE